MPRAVLVAEDDAIVALDLQEQLLSAGHIVSGPFCTASDAIRSLAKTRPALAIVDFRLEDGPAVELIAVLKRMSVPFVIVTVSAKNELPEDLRPVRIYSKPFIMSDLSQLVDKAVRGDLGTVPGAAVEVPRRSI